MQPEEAGGQGVVASRSGAGSGLARSWHQETRRLAYLGRGSGLQLLTHPHMTFVPSTVHRQWKQVETTTLDTFLDLKSVKQPDSQVCCPRMDCMISEILQNRWTNILR